MLQDLKQGPRLDLRNVFMAINFILRIFYCAGKAKNQLPTIWKFCARCSFGEMLLDEMLLAGCPFGEMLWRNALFK